MTISFSVMAYDMGRADESLRETSRDFAGFSQGGRREDSLRPVHPRSRHPAADAGKARDSPRAQGVRAAGDARPGSSESPVQGRAAGTPLARDLRRRGQSLEPRGRDSRGARRPGPRPAVHPDRARVRLRVLRGRHHAAERDETTGSTLVLARVGQAALSSVSRANTSSDAIPMSRSGSTHRRSPAVTRGSW